MPTLTAICKENIKLSGPDLYQRKIVPKIEQVHVLRAAWLIQQMQFIRTQLRHACEHLDDNTIKELGKMEKGNKRDDEWTKAYVDLLEKGRWHISPPMYAAANVFATAHGFLRDTREQLEIDDIWKIDPARKVLEEPKGGTIPIDEAMDRFNSLIADS